jgi:transcription initiation factor TFIID subunit 15
LYKLVVESMPEGCSWQDLKDFVKSGGHNIKFADIKDGKGLAGFEHQEDAEKALEALNNTVLKTRQGAESTVTMTLEMPSVAEESREESTEDRKDADAEMDRRSRSRSRSQDE